MSPSRASAAASAFPAGTPARSSAASGEREVAVLGGAGVEPADAPVELGGVDGVVEEVVAHGPVDDLADAAEVLADLVDLADDPVEEREVLVERGREVERGDVAGLPVPVDAAVALLHAHRVPGDLPVQHVPAGALQVEPLGGDVGGDEQPQRVGRGR